MQRRFFLGAAAGSVAGFCLGYAWPSTRHMTCAPTDAVCILRELMATNSAPQGDGVYRADGFNVADAIDFTRSTNVLHDQARSAIHAARVHYADWLNEEWDSLGAWNATAGATIINPSDTDPMVGNVLSLDTGAAPRGMASAWRSTVALPAVYELGYIAKHQKGQVSADQALYLEVTDVSGAMFRMRTYADRIEVYTNSAWRTQAVRAPVNNDYRELWQRVERNSDGSHSMTLYAGTQQTGVVMRGMLPGGQPMNRVVIRQESGSASSVVGHVASLHIGPTQRAEAIEAVSQPWRAQKDALRSLLTFFYEDVSVTMRPNETVFADVSSDDGATWVNAPLSVAEIIGNGEIGTKKWIYALTGEAELAVPGRDMRWRIRTTAGGFPVIQGVYQRVIFG